MIHFDLICQNGHEFDSWFASNSAFDQQQKTNLVTCPYCNTDKVEKCLMVPSIPAKANKKSSDATNEPPRQPASGQEDQRPSLLSAHNDPDMQELAENIRKMRQHVSENAEYVGKDFAKEAREIHYEEKPARGIYGETSLEEAKSLIEEGVDVMPLPTLPEEKT